MHRIESVWEAWLTWYVAYTTTTVTKAFDRVDVRKPLTKTTFERGFIPLAVCYILMSLLVILPGTRYLRMALCPVTLYGFLNAGVHWDLVTRGQHLLTKTSSLVPPLSTLQILKTGARSSPSSWPCASSSGHYKKRPINVLAFPTPRPFRPSTTVWT